MSILPDLPNLKGLVRSHLPLSLFLLIFAALGTYYLINSFAASSPNVYIAQTATGSANGTDCADAEPVSFFNTSSNWGSNSGQIGPGTTVHLCGTITTSLTAQGSGVSGSPITILWENGASLSEPYCPNSGCFYTNNQTYLTLDGGANGSILSTANGTELANQQSGVMGLKAVNCNGCTIKNLNISNMYQIATPAFTADETSGNATLTGVSSMVGLHVGEGVTGANIPSGDTISSLGTNAITLASAPTATASGQSLSAWDVRINVGNGNGGMSYSGSNITIADNTLHDDDWAINAVQNITDVNVKLYGNNIYNSDHDLALVVNSASGGSIGPVEVYDNHFHDFANWDTPSPWDSYHHDGIHCYTSDGGAAAHYNGLYIYDNRFDGNVGQTMTSQIFMEGSAAGTPCSDDTSNIWIFNNVVMGSPTNDTVEAMTLSGTHVINNTATANNFNGSQCYSSAGGMGAFENNIADLCGSAVGNGYNGVDAVKSGTTDYNVYGDSGGTGGNEFVWGGTAGSGAVYTDNFATWKSDCGCDTHSIQVDNANHTAAMLNSDGTAQTGSPVIGAGTNLTSLCTGVLAALCTSYTGPPVNGTAGSTTPGVPRPATGAWDAGAYQTAPPVNTSLPAVSGKAKEGQALIASSGSWTNSPTYAYQWYDCDAVGKNCTAIAGATGSSYTPGWTDLGYTEYVAVTATNGAGSATASSGLTPAVGVPAWNPASTANIWVNTTAGSCTRNSTPAAYSASTACGSFASAYAAASCGDTIEIEPGTYDTQTLSNVAALDTCTVPVTIEGASTSSPPVIGEVNGLYNGQGASNFILEGISQTATSCTSATGGNCDIIFLSGGKNVYINQVSGGNIGVYANQHVLVENSTFGPCYTGTIASGDCTGNVPIDGTWVNCKGSYCNTSDVTFRNNTFQEFIDNKTGGHFECMFLFGAPDVMIDSNHFHICQLHSIFIQPTTSMDKTIIQNNTFDEVENTVSAAPYYDTSYVAADSSNHAVDFGLNSAAQASNAADIIIRFNSFDAHSGVVSSSATYFPTSPVEVYGNIIGSRDTTGSCLSNVTYGYNVVQSGNATCGTSEATVSPLPYTSQAYGSEDFHLTSGSTAQNFVSPNTADYQLSYDLDGNPRPADGPRDAGAYEYLPAITTDLNSDSHVNIFDLSIFLDHLGQTGTNLPGDFNSDGKVDTTDLTTLQGQWGR